MTRKLVAVRQRIEHAEMNANAHGFTYGAGDPLRDARYLLDVAEMADEYLKSAAAYSNGGPGDGTWERFHAADEDLRRLLRRRER